METTHLQELKNVTQIYTSGDLDFTAIKDVNLILRPGEFVALVGPSGCGKSTLLRIMAGLQTPTEGQVLYRGQPVKGVNPNVAIVFQTFALFPWLSVQQNVEVALKARGVPPDSRSARAVDLLDRVGLDGFETAYPRELSSGMRQKAGIARAMAVEPEILFLDEPFSALDVLSAEALRGELLELWLGGEMPTKAILMVTHNIEEAVLMADRVLVMGTAPGRMVDNIPVTLPHPRPRKAPEFLALVDQVYARLAGETQPEDQAVVIAPGEPVPMRALPHIAINNLIGILEHLDDTPENRDDIYRLADDVHLGSDDILALIEAAELLGFAVLKDGDILLTPLGESFASAGILDRKQLFATRVPDLPLFRWLMDLLEATEKRRLKWDVVQAALALDFPVLEAERQLQTMVEWGRYAEILSYDDSTATIYAEPHPET